MATDGSNKVLNEGNINKNVRNVEYAVRGALAIRAEEIREGLERGEKFPFKNIVGCNIGNPQQVGQKPITFFRQVAALTEVPELLEDENLAKTEALFPKDVIARAREIISHVKTVGAYSHSQGVPYIRQRVAKFIEERDGFPADPNHIFLTSGASAGVQLGLQLLIEHSNVGVMIPIPQYPLYTATLALFDGKPVPYYLDESNDWGLNVDELRTNLKKARDEGVDVRSLVIINPGNPTGQCLTFDNMKEIIQLCKEEKLILMADEVYQVNIYQPENRPFHSFKKVLRSMGSEYDDIELISFHSISKGMIGECGRRGGYFELCGFDPKVVAQIYKIASVSLCPNVPGQIMVDLMLHPPVQGDESYDLYHKELNGIYESLKRRAIKLCGAFNSLEGVTCNAAQGAMYLFPQITLPPKVVEAAKAQNTQPDALYCMDLLNATGVCLVPGSGFGQKDGTYHFRSTFLPSENLFDEFLNGIKEFHEQFLVKYK